MIQKAEYVRQNVVSRLKRYLAADLDMGILTAGEYNLITEAVRALSKTGKSPPEVQPKLLKTEEVAEMLAISKSQLRALEAEGKLPLPRKMVGSSVRYLNIDVIRYMTENNSDSEE